MTEIYVIRHVQAEGNLYRMCRATGTGTLPPWAWSSGMRWRSVSETSL